MCGCKGGRGGGVVNRAMAPAAGQLAANDAYVQLFYAGQFSSGSTLFMSENGSTWYKVPASRIVQVYPADVDYLLGLRDESNQPKFLNNDLYQIYKQGGMQAVMAELATVTP